MRRAPAGMLKETMAKDSRKNVAETEFRSGGIDLKNIELREIEMPLKYSFETSFGVTSKRRVLVVRVIDSSGASGYGECTAMEQPFYNHESVDTASAIIAGCIAPILSAASISYAADVSRVLAPIRGNRMAIAAIETAVWDLEAKLLDKPLWQHLGGTLSEINCGVSIGLQSSPDVLIERVEREVEAGYQRIKLKIKPGKDIEYVKAVRRKFPDILLSVDANSAYDLESNIEVLQELDNYDLLMIEQPLAAGDLLDHSKLQPRLRTPICLDESITSLRDAQQAIEMDACRIINIKLGRVGGHSQAKAIEEFAKAKNIPVWCGGMLETGIGRAHNIAMSAFDGFSLPGDVSASSRYWEEDVIEPPVEVSKNGTIKTRGQAGIGFDVKTGLLHSITLRTITISLP